MPKKAQGQPIDSTDWPTVRLVYIGRRDDGEGGNIRHVYLYEGTRETAAFKNKLQRSHAIGGVYEAKRQEDRFVVRRSGSGGYVGPYSNRAEVIEWKTLDAAVDTASEMVNAAGRHVRALIEASFGPVRVVYRKLGRTGRAALIGSLIAYLNEDTNAEAALNQAVERLRQLDRELKK